MWLKSGQTRKYLGIGDGYMSMKFMGQIQQDHMKIREIEEKHKDELENKIEKFTKRLRN